uniref:Membrane protein a148 n=1 Tax=Mastomys natalensis cytomegalovirus 2 TaxID=2973540 RepID=A0A9Y1IK47_9BETA|nr:membrane protein a148 [Mastomys natalensis cytomegalovirus 2]WEG69274.1 membrane protein a148 [Mastomys natalensis cytomegalovirus 2]WEG69413.1 membrane protein a148 [Mastomys natalensis cytomegalovirus 2]WEG69551.1 membrane protein a148 [Mastomys natalensis cytomegalovirus 2]WEG69689.1 membrane protein a148 [Mastomys natalensis cytomegalovirus 2]
MNVLHSYTLIIPYILTCVLYVPREITLSIAQEQLSFTVTSRDENRGIIYSYILALNYSFPLLWYDGSIKWMYSKEDERTLIDVITTRWKPGLQNIRHLFFDESSVFILETICTGSLDYVECNFILCRQAIIEKSMTYKGMPSHDVSSYETQSIDDDLILKRTELRDYILRYNEYVTIYRNMLIAHRRLTSISGPDELQATLYVSGDGINGTATCHIKSLIPVKFNISIWLSAEQVSYAESVENIENLIYTDQYGRLTSRTFGAFAMLPIQINIPMKFWCVAISYLGWEAHFSATVVHDVDPRAAHQQIRMSRIDPHETPFKRKLPMSRKKIHAKNMFRVNEMLMISVPVTAVIAIISVVCILCIQKRFSCMRCPNNMQELINRYI